MFLFILNKNKNHTFSLKIQLYILTFILEQTVPLLQTCTLNMFCFVSRHLSFIIMNESQAVKTLPYVNLKAA